MSNIFNIKSNYNFLESLVCWVLQEYGADLIYLSKVTILLPSRRSCRVIKEIFLKQAGKNAIILPNIMAIGDIDKHEIGLKFLELNQLSDFNKLVVKPSSSLKYRCLLIDEIRKFNDKTHLFGKNIHTNQIDLIASNLEDFLAEVDREELDLDNLENVDEIDLATHKQKILQFLRHFGSNWRQVLAKNDLKYNLSYQREIIDLNSKYLDQNKTEFPIIAAGSTGSMKATSRLLKTISSLENGFIFLFGLDKDIKPEIWDVISDSHPQFMLKRLLETLKILPNQVKDIKFEQFQQKDEQINKLLSYSFLPASKTDIWTKINDLSEVSVQDLTQIECKDSFDEAAIISLIMLKAINQKDQSAALVTSDKNLAMMVKEILLKFDVNIDNSKNNKLVDSEIVSYLLSIAVFMTLDFKASNLLTILKNKITRVGFEDVFYLDNLKLFELEILRKNFSLKNIDLVAQKIEEFNDDNLSDWFKKIRTTLNIFSLKEGKSSFYQVLLKNLECAKKLSENNKNEIGLDKLTGVEEFFEFLEEVRGEASSFKVESEVYYKILRQFLSGYNFDIKQNHHPRLHILSPIEARLMNFDVMIVSNLNENEFSSQIKTQNWLSRKMRLDFGLSDLTRKIGVSAFDFSNYLGNRQVFLTRSLLSNNSPTTKLRFLLKLETVLKATNLVDKLDDGKYWYFLLEEFNNFQEDNRFLSEKKRHQQLSKNLANPPLKDRIKKISVTDVGKWIRDPYYIYAKRILNLKPLNKIDEEASFANFGNFVHETLENFVNDYDKIDKNNRLNILLTTYGQKYFIKYFLNQENHLLWWPRFENIAKWFIKNEIEVRKNLKNCDTELSANIVIDGVNISTKIDRINVDLEGNIEIIDYKTGMIAAALDIRKGLEPQLPLEALIFLNKNGFDLENVKKLQYYCAKGRDKNEIKDLKDVDKLIKAANNGIEQLIDIFNKFKTPFYPCPDPDIYKKNEYHHLARIDDI